MVGRQSHLHHLSGNDLVVTHNGLLQDARYGENRTFTRIDDGREILDIELILAAYSHRDGNFVLVTTAISGVLSSEF